MILNIWNFVIVTAIVVILAYFKETWLLIFPLAIIWFLLNKEYISGFFILLLFIFDAVELKKGEEKMKKFRQKDEELYMKLFY